MEKKITATESFTAIKEVLSQDAEANAKLIAFVDNKLAQLARVKEYGKNHPAKRTVNPETEARKATVLAVVTAEEQTAKQIGTLAKMSGAQAAGSLRSLTADGKVVAVKNEGKPNTYKLA